MKKLGKKELFSSDTIEAYKSCSSLCSSPDCNSDCGLIKAWADASNNKYYTSTVLMYNNSGGK